MTLFRHSDNFAYGKSITSFEGCLVAEKIILPLDDESEDIVMRLSADEATALYRLLSRMSLDEMMQKGLSKDQALAVTRVIHVTY
ncbi:hypothetical protein HCG45_21510 [Pseudomonas fulva]|uniref:hypothetical protein n=1 Tax=Pseudomonas fulva TaxID=47880 RepID=UPI0014288BC1|nr:hypothetical protein [Pseudomonas fulva]NIX95317.1 hypothetical protein [Pseudomonas fulva]